jgi:CHAT domain-containing protein
MDRFYTALTAAGRAAAPAALRSAQLAAAQTGVHPYFWAPYVAYDSAAMS